MTEKDSSMVPAGSGGAGAGGLPASQAKDLERVSIIVYDLIHNLPASLEANEAIFRKAVSYQQGSTLLAACALYKIHEGRLWAGKFDSAEAYRLAATERLGLGEKSKTTFYNYVRMGYTFTTFEQDFYRSGFQEGKDSSKLLWFEEAAERHGTKEAVKQLPKMSARAFSAWARGLDVDAEEGDGAGVAVAVPEVFEVSERGIAYDGRMMISVKRVQEIVERGERPLVVGVRSDGEARRVGLFLKRMREEGATADETAGGTEE